MSSHTKRRLEHHILEVLTELIAREVRDPRAEDAVVTGVRLNDDNSVARVFVMGGGEEAIRGLRKAAGFLRGQLGRTLKVRTAPALRFEEDESLDRYNRIESLLEDPAPPSAPDAETEDGD